MPDTEEVKKQETNEQMLKKGTRNGIQEAQDRRDERGEEVVRRRLQLLAV